MKLIFAGMPVPSEMIKSIFLAGPSPRSKDVYDWRNEAIQFLRELKFDGHVFIPIPREKFYGEDDSADWTYDGQVEWEKKFRKLADKIMFWIPRDIAGGMPGFTTNVEFGEDLHSGKIVYGRPENAEKCRYLDSEITAKGLPIYYELKWMLQNVVSQLGEGSLRLDGEVYVPLFVWNSEQFKSWYANLQAAGNTLLYADVMNQVSFNNHLFCYTLYVQVWIAEEHRKKENEVVISRKDISSVFAYYRDGEDTKIILVKEFRSPVNNDKGYVYELPGGSSVKVGIDPRENAREELSEEVGVLVDDITRFEFVGKRQLAATMLTHQSVVYKIELNKAEYEQAVSSWTNKKSFGVAEDSEITYVEIVSLKDIFTLPIDYSMLGMLYQGLNG